MKATQKITLLIALVLITALALPGTALAAGAADRPHDEFVFGNTYTLHSGDTLDGNLFVFGGIATLESGSTVTGSVMVMGGTLSISGKVDGDVQVMGGYIKLTSSAVVNGDVSSLGGYLDQDSGATILGTVSTEEQVGAWDFGDIRQWDTFPMRQFQTFPNLDAFGILWDGFFYILTVFVMAFLAMAIVMFWPQHTARVAHAIVAQPLMTGGLGLLTILVVPAVLILLTITIILSPVALVGFIVLVVLCVFGWIALGLEIGQRMAAMFKTEWHPAVAAGLGTFALTFLVGGVYTVFNQFCCCIGWIGLIVVGCLGLGSAMLTGFGTVDYPGPVKLTPVPVKPTPPASPIPQVAAAPMSEPVIAEESTPAPDETVISSLDEFAEGESESKPKRTRKNDSVA